VVVVLGAVLVALVGLGTATPPRSLDPAEDGLIRPQAAIAKARATTAKTMDLDQRRGGRRLRGHIGSLPPPLARRRRSSDPTIAAPRAGIRLRLLEGHSFHKREHPPIWTSFLRFPEGVSEPESGIDLLGIAGIDSESQNRRLPRRQAATRRVIRVTHHDVRLRRVAPRY
jgi:hypothetical protein